MVNYYSTVIGLFQKISMTSDISKKLKKFADLVRIEYSSKNEIILFGSFAKGKNKRWSDIDVAIILPKVTDRLKSEISLRLKSIDIDERINPFIFTHQELQENSPLIWEIKKYGKKIQFS